MIGQAGDSEDDVVLAGEYVLGLLEGEVRADFELRLTNEQRLAVLARDWSVQIAALADEIDTVAPPASLKLQIENKLFGPSVPPRRWRWGGGLVAALTLVFAAAVIFPDLIFPPAPVVTEIAAEDRSLVIAVSYAAGSGVLDINRVSGDVADGRAQELWLIADGAPAPVSLGLLADAGPTRLTVSEALRASVPGATLAISDEPPGGSPTGAPTGAVLAAGVLPEV